MALVKYGQGVAGMSGKIGGTIHSRGRTGATVKNWTKPCNAMTAKQTRRRATFQQQSSAWGDLTDVQRRGWDAYAQTQIRLNRQGDAYVPSGRQIYTELNSNLTLVGSANIVAPPIGQAPPAIDPDLAIGVEETAGVLTEFLLTGGATDATVSWVIDGAPPQLTGRQNVTRQMRFLGVGVAGASVDIEAMYVGVFGSTMPLAANVQIRVRAVTKATGLSSTILLVEGIAVAA